MYETIQKLRNNSVVLRTALIFLASYVLFLFVWIQVKDYYGTGVTVAASKLLTLVKDVSYEGVTRVGEAIEVTFSPLSRRDMLVDIPVNTSSYTFNAPLTLSLMATLWLFIGKKGKAYSEALLILLGVHLLYVFSLEWKTLTEILMQWGIDRENNLPLFFSQFLWGFTDNMVIRFEPFLIGFYMFIRFGK